MTTQNSSIIPQFILCNIDYILKNVGKTIYHKSKNQRMEMCLTQIITHIGFDVLKKDQIALYI